MLKKIMLCILVLIILAISIRIYMHYTHWSMKDIDDKTVIPLTQKVESIRDGIPFAEMRAKEWNKDAILTNINIVFEGQDAIKSKKGRIQYEYYVKNSDNIGLPHAICWVKIDVEKQAIVRFIAFGGKRLSGTPFDISGWNISIDEAFDLAESAGASQVINKYQDPKVVIRTAKNFWDFAIFTSYNSEDSIEDACFTIDPANKQLIRTYRAGNKQ